jgi:hypothetical protein
MCRDEVAVGAVFVIDFVVKSAADAWSIEAPAIIAMAISGIRKR